MEVIGIGELYSKAEVVTRSKEQIESDIQKTENQLEIIRRKGDEIYNSFSEETQDEINDICLEIFENEDLPPLEKNKKMEEILVGYVDRPEVTEVVRLIFEEDKTENILMGFQNEYVPFKAEELKNFTNQLSSQIDFNRVISYFVGTEEGSSELMINSFEEFNFLEGVIVAGSNGNLEKNDFKKLDEAEIFLRDCEERWGGKGFLGGKSDLLEEDGNLKKIDLFNKVNRISNELIISNRLFLIYRPQAVSINREENIKFLKEMENFLFGEHIFKYGFNGLKNEYLSYNKGFLKAIEKKVGEIENGLKIEGKLTQSEEEQKVFIESKMAVWETVLDKLEISGLEKDDDKKLVVTKDKINEFLRGSFPSAFVKKIEKIQASKEIQSEDVDLNDNSENNPNVVVAGSYKPKYNERADLISGEIFIYEPICVDKDDGEIIEKIIEGNFKKTLTHEIGHGVHCGLSVDDLEKWEETIKQDTTKVTWYVGYSETKSEFVKRREDFCESFMMFVDSPGLLKVVSEDRFKFMSDLFEKYMDKENLDSFKNSLKLTLLLSDMIWKKNGRKKEEIRNYYLRSERLI